MLKYLLLAITRWVPALSSVSSEVRSEKLQTSNPIPLNQTALKIERMHAVEVSWHAEAP